MKNELNNDLDEFQDDEQPDAHDEIAQMLGELAKPAEELADKVDEQSDSTKEVINEEDESGDDVGDDQDADKGSDDSGLDSSDDPTPTVADTGTDEKSEVTDEFQQLKDQNAALLKRIEELSSAKASEPVQEEAAEFKPEKYSELFENLDLDNVIDSENNFKNFLLKFAALVHRDVTEQLSPQIPGVVKKQIERHMTMQEIREDFYRRHEVLNPVRSYVAQIANVVAQENSELSLQEVLEEAAKRAKSALNIADVKPKKKEDAVKEKSPAFVKASGTDRGKPKEKIDPVHQEILEMMTA